MAVGLGLAIGGGVGDEPVLTGVGLGLFGQSVTMLTLDMFADARADRWAEAIRAAP